MQVSIASIIFMVFSAVVSIGLPITLFIIFYKKYNSKILPMIIGILGFIIFALVLKRYVHLIIFSKYITIEKPLIYIIYTIFMAGIFEETARFISFKILKKKYNGIGTGLAYGIGHGGIESILLVGMTLINTIILSITLNSGNIETVINNLQGEALEQVNIQISTLIANPPYLYLFGGIERIFSILVHLSLSVMVFYSVYVKNRVWLYPFAILLHAIINIPAAMAQVGILKNVFLIEFLILIGTIILIIIAKYIHKKLKQNIIET